MTEAEADYLLAAVNRYIVRPLTPADIVHRYAGVRPLILETGKGDRETSRDYRLVAHAGVPALTVVGGKITTYRVLAEAVLKISRAQDEEVDRFRAAARRRRPAAGGRERPGRVQALARQSDPNL